MSSVSGHRTGAKQYLVGREAGLLGQIEGNNLESRQAVRDGIVSTAVEQRRSNYGGDLPKELESTGLKNDSRFLLLLTDGKGLQNQLNKPLLERVLIRLLGFAYNGVLWNGERPLPEISEFSIEDMKEISERNLAFLELLKLPKAELLIIMLSYASLKTLMKSGLGATGQTLREMAIQYIAQTCTAKDVEVGLDSIFQLIDWRLITCSSTSASLSREASSLELAYTSTLSPGIGGLPQL